MTEMDLVEKHHVTTLTRNRSLEEHHIDQYMSTLPVEWRLYGSRRLAREYQFENFSSGVEFVKEIEQLAEQEQHPPFVCFRFPKVQVELSTLDISGLSEKDFIIASRIDKLYVKF